MDVGRLIVRGTVGPLFVGHGMQKLFGTFGGHGLEATAQHFDEQLGMRPGRAHALAAGAAESLGGALLTLGALTPFAAAMLDGVMATAVRKVHGKNGVWVEQGGFEYNLVIAAALALLAEQGPGRPSVDAAALPRFHGTVAMLAAAALGIGGSFASERLLGSAPVRRATGRGPETGRAGAPAAPPVGAPA